MDQALTKSRLVDQALTRSRLVDQALTRGRLRTVRWTRRWKGASCSEFFQHKGNMKEWQLMNIALQS